MRAVIQRVASASVTIDGQTIDRIRTGLLVYVGIGEDDSEADLDSMVQKIRYLRIFPDDQGKMNRDVAEAEGGVLVVSNFTLYGDVRKGRRPAFTGAAPPEQANELYERLCDGLRAEGLEVATGRFRKSMAVESVNAGPINILLDSRRRF
ncbi:MAG: D-aminoacyl-tRNA deacylase [Phycisphaerae bacterium]